MRLQTLMQEARACTVCAKHLPEGPRPLLQGSAKAKVLLIGQAPGLTAHQTGIPWDDRSGARLREWLGISDDHFYDPEKVALLPMGFCYPGKARSGDAPPRPECAPAWHPPLLEAFQAVRLTIYLGKYALARYLPDRYDTITEAAADYAALLPNQLVLPHPSPRNTLWLKKHPWFETEVLPKLQRRARSLMKP